MAWRHGVTISYQQERKQTMITLPNFPAKHDTAAYTRDMKPLGWVHCFGATEWKAYDASGVFIDWFPTKKAALSALAA
jgi:hypothetical protein